MAQLEDTRLAGRLREALVDDEDFLLGIVRTALQQFLEAEMTEHLNAAPHERTEDRRGH